MNRKLQHQTGEQTTHEQQAHSGQQQQAREWATADEALKEDAANVQVPPTIEARLRDSVAQEPAPQKGWWKRLFQ
jgi:hypothetical protein